MQHSEMHPCLYYMKFRCSLVILVILLVASCRKQGNQNLKEKLYGPWDSYRAILPDNTVEGPAPWILCSYEPGFEIFADGTYRPGYANNSASDLSMTTSQDTRSKGTWTLNKDTLNFLLILDPGICKFQFLITSFDDSELVIKYLFAEYPVYYLKKG